MTDQVTSGVLIVDDHAPYAQGLRTLLESTSPQFDLYATSAPEDALGIVERNRPDVVLVDVRMPRMNGIQLAERISDISPRSRILMLTVSDDPDDVRSAFRAGAVGYLSKDLDAEQVAAAVTLSLAGAVTLSKNAFDVLTGGSAEDPTLSRDDRLLLGLAADGLSMDQIAQRVAVSRATATRMLGRLQEKFGVSNRDQLVAFAARRGWV